jgi:MarR-like DNA-binding transcriptional regulator SgrR of sgrS sRNA
VGTFWLFLFGLPLIMRISEAGRGEDAAIEFRQAMEQMAEEEAAKKREDQAAEMKTFLRPDQLDIRP